MIRIPWYVGWPGVAVCAAVIFHWAANRAVYYPLKYPDGYWHFQQQLRAEDVWLRAADGVKLHAWWVPAAGARMATLFLHGNAGNLSHRIGHMGAIPQAGSSLLVLDYRGYGRSEGRPTEEGLYADADAAYAWLAAAGYGPERIVLHGESLGTAVAVDLAARKPCAGVVLEAPFTSARDIAARVLPVVGPLAVRGFDSRAKIARVHAPLLVIHGDRDAVVPYELGRALFAAANEPKAFWTVAGADHNNLRDAAGAEYVSRLRAFYAQRQ